MPVHARCARRLGAPVDTLFGLYAAVSGCALLFPHRPPAWPALAIAHLCAIGLAAAPAEARRAWTAFCRRWPRLACFLGDWYPLLLIFGLYAELVVLNRAVHGGRYFDSIVLGWEHRLFPSSPSQTWAAARPYPLLSEVLHASYLSYYVIIYGPPLVLWLGGRRDAFRRGVFTLMLVFFVHYVFFIYFPVQGPRYLFPAPGGPIADGLFYRLAHRLLEVGSSRGAAFPSSHVGVSVAQTVIVLRYMPRFAPVVALLALGLALGAVYGGFHYGTDAVVGAALGLCLALAGPRLYDRLLVRRGSVVDA